MLVGRKAVAFEKARQAAAALERTAGGAIRSAGKRLARQNSKSPYKRPKAGAVPAAAAAASSSSQPPQPSATAGLQAAMDAMLLGPISARTRLRQHAMFLKRPGQMALASALTVPTAAAGAGARPRTGGASGQKASTASKPQPRLVAPRDKAAHLQTDLGAKTLAPREALAAARRKSGGKSFAKSSAGGVSAYSQYNHPSMAATRNSMRQADGRARDEGARTVRVAAH